MTEVELSKEPKALQQKARKFVIEEILPVSRKHDISGEFQWKVFQNAFDVGFINMQIPKSLNNHTRRKFVFMSLS